MRRILLDTHALLWFIADSGGSLGPKALAVIVAPENRIYVSAASTWEISIKCALGKLEAPRDMDTVVGEKSFLKLPIALAHGDRAGALPPLHNDPFDRMLIAQSQMEGLELMTSDQKIRQYPVACVDPTR
ncbi:MAG: PIN domain nuclease of toxin-antitoxin system [Rhodothermales bacterium]|jgi:PIN domain nuclease of toxin-antitoxin system